MLGICLKRETQYGQKNMPRLFCFVLFSLSLLIVASRQTPLADEIRPSLLGNPELLKVPFFKLGMQFCVHCLLCRNVTSGFHQFLSISLFCFSPLLVIHNVRNTCVMIAYNKFLCQLMNHAPPPPPPLVFFFFFF